MTIPFGGGYTYRTANGFWCAANEPAGAFHFGAGPLLRAIQAAARLCVKKIHKKVN